MSQTMIDVSTLVPVAQLTLQTLTETQTRNLKAAVLAHTVLVETAQTVLRRQVDMTQTNLQDAAEQAKAVLSAKDLSSALSLQIDFATSTVEKAGVQLREVTELTVRGGQQAFQILRQRTEQTAGEVRALTQAAA
jgi:phasin family protein